jgi:hypothetical protein
MTIEIELRLWPAGRGETDRFAVAGAAHHSRCKRRAIEKSLPENQQFAFLPKPFTLSQLVAAVKETMAPS